MIIKQYELPLAEALDPGTILPSKDGEDQQVRELSILEEALAILAQRHQRGEVLSSPEATRSFLRLKLAEKPSEVFGCILGFLAQTAGNMQ